MNLRLNRFDLKSISLATLSLCLFIGQPGLAIELVQKSAAKPLINFQSYDLKKSTDLKSLKLDHIRVKEKMGPGSGSGGDFCALMILANTKSLLVKIYDENLFGKDKEIPQKLENAVLNASIYYSPELEDNGKTVDVLNYPAEDKLVVSERFCQRISDVSVRSMGVLLHEYLGLAEIEDRKYEISSSFVTPMQASGYNPRTVDGTEYLKSMTGYNLEVQEDILFVANNEFLKVNVPNDDGRDIWAGIGVTNVKNYDRVLPKGTQVQILKVIPAGFTSVLGTCGFTFEIRLNHSEVNRILINWTSNHPTLCAERASVTNVEHFYKVLGRYFLIKPKAPVVMK